MRGPEFAAILARLPAAQPLTAEFEERHRQGSSHPKAWYRDQREHMVGWFSEIEGPGAYGRKTRGREAKAAYNSLRCAPALIWMAEALGEDPDAVRHAAADAEAAGPNYSSQCAAIRRVVPWTRIESLVERVQRQESDASSAVMRKLRRLLS